MATVFERLEEKMEKVLEAIQKVLTVQEESIKIFKSSKGTEGGAASISEDSSAKIDQIDQKLTEYFSNFSDLIGSKLDDLQDEIERVKKKGVDAKGGSVDSSGVIGEIQDLKRDFRALSDTLFSLQDGIGYISDAMNKLRNEVETLKGAGQQIARVETPQVTQPAITVKNERPSVVETMYKGAIRSSQPKKVGTQPESATPSKVVKEMYLDSIKPKKVAIEQVSTETMTSGSVAQVEGKMKEAGKIGKVPAEVFDLLDSIKPKMNLPVQDLARFIEFIRDKIVKVFKFHPALYELGTFARKVKKYPSNSLLDADLTNLLNDKINEWKKRLSGYSI